MFAHRGRDAIGIEIGIGIGIGIEIAMPPPQGGRDARAPRADTQVRPYSQNGGIVTLTIASRRHGGRPPRFPIFFGNLGGLSLSAGRTGRSAPTMPVVISNVGANLRVCPSRPGRHRDRNRDRDRNRYARRHQAGGTPALPGRTRGSAPTTKMVVSSPLQSPRAGTAADLRGFQFFLETSEVFICLRGGHGGPPLQCRR